MFRMPRSTNCMAAADVTGLVIDAIQITESIAIGLFAPSLRLPNAPS